MRTRLPILSAISADSPVARIVDIIIDSNGKSTYLYDLDCLVDMEKFANNDVSHVRAKIVVSKSGMSTSKIRSLILTKALGGSTSFAAVSGMSMAGALDESAGGESSLLSTTETQGDGPDGGTPGQFIIDTTGESIKSSYTAEIASALVLSKFDQMNDFQTTKNSQVATIIDQETQNISNFLNVDAWTYAVRKAQQAKSTMLSEPTSTRKSSGLTGATLSKSTFQGLKRSPGHISFAGIVSDVVEMTVIDRKEARKVLGTTDDKIDPHVSLSIPSDSGALPASMGTMTEFERDPATGAVVPSSTQPTLSAALGTMSTSTVSLGLSGMTNSVVSTTTSFQEACYNALTKYETSPPMLIPVSISSLVTSADAMYQGTSTATRKSLGDSGLATTKSKEDRAKQMREDERVSGDVSDDVRSLTAVLRSDYYSLPSKSPTSLSDLPGEKYVVIPTSKTFSNIEMSFSFSISEAKLISGKFVVIFDLLNSKKQIIGTKSATVDHNFLKQDFLSPSIAPKITAVSSRAFGVKTGDVKLSISQLDTDATQILVYKRIVSKDTLVKGENTEFSLLGTYSLTHFSDSMIIEDSDVDLSQCIIYRAVARSDIGASGNFQDAVVVFESQRLFSACVHAKNETNGIGITVTSVFGSPVAMVLKRRNASRYETEYETIKNARVLDESDKADSESIKAGTILSKLAAGDIKSGFADLALASLSTQHTVSTDDVFIEEDDTFLDTTAQIGETYEYRVAAMFDSGDEVLTDTCEFIKREVPGGQIDIQSSGQTVSISPTGAYQVTFSINSTQPGESAVQYAEKFFTSSGLKSTYAAEMEDVKTSLEPVVGCIVERKDLKTGDVEQFTSTSPPGKFVDNGTHGVSKPQPGRTYCYSIKSYAVNPKQFLEEMKIRESTNTTKYDKLKGGGAMLDPDVVSKLNSPTSFDPCYTAKFVSTTAVTDSTLSYGDAGMEQHAGDILEISGVASTTSFDIAIPSTTVKSITGSARVNANRQVILTWSASGIADDISIDFFIILVRRMGMTIPVGVAHGTAIGSSFRFVDDSQAEILGQAKYIVVPVYGDYSTGNKYTLGTVLIS